MVNSRLHLLISALEKEEIRALQKFIRSPFFNQKQEVISAFDYLIECIFTLKLVPTKEQLFKKLYPKRFYEVQQVRYVMSWLLQLIEFYLSIKNFIRDDAKRQIQLAATYREKKLDKHFHQTIRSLKTRQEKTPFRNADYYETSYLIQLEEYAYSASQKRSSQHNLQEITVNTDLVYLTRKLRQTCLLLSHQAVYQTEYDFGLLNYGLQYIEQKGLLNYPAISIYYHCYYALANPSNEKHFYTFKNLLLDKGSIFPSDELRDLYLLAINYCIRRLNAEEEHFAREGLDLYKSGFENGILIYEGTISRFTYRNVVAMALKEGELEWAAFFIQQYRPFLDKAHQESMYSFNMARIAYSQKNYGQVLELLQKIEYQDPLLNLAAKTILIKVYYETDEYELLHAHLDAMREYIRRKRVIGYHRSNYQNIIRATKKLMTLPPYDKVAINKFKQQIKSDDILTEREWLLGQLN